MAVADNTSAKPPAGDTHRLTAVRSGRWWAIKVEDLPGCYSQARRRSRIESMARDAIALWFGVDQDEVGPLVISFTEPS